MGKERKLDHDVLTVDELAKYLRIKPITIYKMKDEWKLPSFKTGTGIRFRREAVDKWVKDQENE